MVGRIVQTFGERVDSKTEIFGVEEGGARYVVKYGVQPEAVRSLENAIRFHHDVRHPAIAAVVDHFRTPEGGLGLVEEWAEGDVLVDAFNPAVRDRDDPASSYRRFLRLPPATIAAAVAQLIDAHVAVTDAGYVAVDLYDGCVIYDFARDAIHLFDLDEYRPGPYVLDVDRQFGSTAYMAPEEFQRGATIDERTTVFTLGRFALILLGNDRHGPPDPISFRGGPGLFDVTRAACAPDPAQRIPTVRELAAAWAAAG